VFHNDSLLYVRFPAATGVVDAEIMVLSLQSHRASKLADGYNIAVSVNGDIAYTTRAADGNETGKVLDRFGREAPNPGGSGRFSWSPDGRWLTSSDGYRGTGVPMKQYIMDFSFGAVTVREFAETLPCNCDGNPGVRWAPDSTRFEYTRLIGSGDRIDRTSDIYEPWGLTHFPSPEFHIWVSSSRYVERGDWEGGQYAIVDIASGFKTAVGRVAALSPDRMLVATIADSQRQTFDVEDTSGTTILAGLDGLPIEISKDGEHVLAASSYGACIGLNVYNVADGERTYCRALAKGSFSPDGTKLAVVALDPPNPVTPQVAEVWLVDLNTGAERRLAADLRGGLGCAKWSADSRYVAITFCPGV
jgi:Tol biopolymer transport system component